MRKLWRRVLWRLGQRSREKRLAAFLASIQLRNYELTGVPDNRLDRELEELCHGKDLP